MAAELKHLDEHRAAVLENLCEAIVPGSRHVQPVVYIDAIMADMPTPQRDAVIHAIDLLRGAVALGAEGLKPLTNTPDFQFIRALAIEAYYSDFLAPGAEGPAPTRRSTSTRRWPCGSKRTGPTCGTARGRFHWEFRWRGTPGSSNMNAERFEVVVVGSGAGGGVVAGELAERGRKVLLLEAGAHYVAADFIRWESRTAHDYWWPLSFAYPAGGAGLGQSR